MHVLSIPSRTVCEESTGAEKLEFVMRGRKIKAHVDGSYGRSNAVEMISYLRANLVESTSGRAAAYQMMKMGGFGSF